MLNCLRKRRSGLLKSATLLASGCLSLPMTGALANPLAVHPVSGANTQTAATLPLLHLGHANANFHTGAVNGSLPIIHQITAGGLSNSAQSSKNTSGNQFVHNSPVSQH